VANGELSFMQQPTETLTISFEVTPEDHVRCNVYFAENTKIVQSAKRRYCYSPPLLWMTVAMLSGIFACLFDRLNADFTPAESIVATGIGIRHKGARRWRGLG